MSKPTVVIRRPSEIEIEAVIIGAEMDRKGLHVPRKAVLQGAAEKKLAIRHERLQRQEFFNRRSGWGNKPFAQLLK